MCIIAICDNGKKLNEKTFKTCFEGNSHGAGFAWIEDEKIHWAKGYMKVQAAYNKYRKIRKFPHVAHFRLTSVGGTSPELTHPFVITPLSPISLRGNGTDSVLFHNGTIHSWQGMLMCISFANKQIPDGPISDTRVMAMGIGILGDGLLANDYGKYVIASPQGFKTYGSWVEDNGIFYSNSSYKSYEKFSSRAFGAWPKEKETDYKLPKQLCGTTVSLLPDDNDESFYDRTVRKLYE